MHADDESAFPDHGPAPSDPRAGNGAVPPSTALLVIPTDLRHVIPTDLRGTA
jgi:hypothetical protein